jgi:hypothetical protein
MPEELKPGEPQTELNQGSDSPFTSFRKPDAAAGAEEHQTEPEDAELTALMADSIRLMAPGFEELISEETRKAQTKLLITSFGVILLASNAITASGTVKSNGFEMTISTHILLVIGMIAVGYFELYRQHVGMPTGNYTNSRELPQTAS